MEIKNTEDCFTFRLLRKIKPDLDKSKKSLELARQKFAGAENAVKLGVFEFAIIESYMSMFHASRAILYKDGIQEKSHFAIYIYLHKK